MAFTLSQWKQLPQIFQKIHPIALSRIWTYLLSLALTHLCGQITASDLPITAEKEYTAQWRKMNVLSHPQVTFTREPLMKKLWIWDPETNKKTSMENLDSRQNQMWKKYWTMSGTEIRSRVNRPIKWFQTLFKCLERIKEWFSEKI